MLRHELSAIFGDMPNTEYAALLKSVQDNGFTHPVIVTYEDKILDGWHRYRVAQHLGRENELTCEAYEGDNPTAFVKAENYHRRHLSVGHRAVIEVKLNNWQAPGGDRRSEKTIPSNDGMKSTAEMAKSAEVSPKSIERAKDVVRAGREDEVISGAKSISQVVKEEREKAEPTPETTEDDILRVVLDSDMVIHDNALAMSRGILRKMPDMSAGNWKALHRNVLRAVHPDRVDMSDWTDEEKTSWTVLFEFLNSFLGELEIDYREYAELKLK